MTMARMTYVFGALALSLVASSPVLAHHSFTAVFDVQKKITLNGRISGIEWVNPHIYVHVDVAGADGKIATWRFETLPPNWMRRANLKREDILDGPEVGKPVTVLANPPRDPAQTLGFLLRLTYADGHYLQLYDNPNTPNP